MRWSYCAIRASHPEKFHRVGVVWHKSDAGAIALVLPFHVIKGQWAIPVCLSRNKVFRIDHRLQPGCASHLLKDCLCDRGLICGLSGGVHGVVLFSVFSWSEYSLAVLVLSRVKQKIFWRWFLVTLGVENFITQTLDNQTRGDYIIS